MANRLFTSQFSYSFERQPVELLSVFTQEAIGSPSELELQDLTYTANAYGEVGDDITIAYVAPVSGTHALSVVVTGTDIVVNLQSTAPVAATGTLDVTNDIILTSVAAGATRNTTTFKTVVNAAAANPTNTILVAFTGTSAAIVCTVTPNDGTNNGAVAVNLTTAQLRELITTGLVVGKNITLTDGSSFRILQTATGGGATNLAHSGEGDNVTATFSGGANFSAAISTADDILAAIEAEPDSDALVSVSVTGTGSDVQTPVSATPLADGEDTEFSQISSFAGMSLSQLSVGTYQLSLSDSYNSLLGIKIMLQRGTAVDLLPQMESADPDSDQVIVFRMQAGATPTNLADDDQLLIGLTLRNSSNATI